MVIVEAVDVEKSFTLRAVLRKVSLRIDSGERVVLLGDNGSGKSTLLHVLAGVLKADRGTVNVRGTVGFAPENADLPEHLVVAEWLDVVASLKGLRRRPPALFGADDLAGIKLAALSLGQRQRVSLAAAWLGDPAILMLDEPTNGVDAHTSADLAARISDHTAIVATHDRDFAGRIATRLVTLRGGTLQ
jgi:ABC-type multidrug transport system ATPase subunit